MNSQRLGADILATATPPLNSSVMKRGDNKARSEKQMRGARGLCKWDHCVFCWKYKEVCIIMLFLGELIESDCSTHH